MSKEVKRLEATKKKRHTGASSNRTEPAGWGIQSEAISDSPGFRLKNCRNDELCRGLRFLASLEMTEKEDFRSDTK